MAVNSNAVGSWLQRLSSVVVEVSIQGSESQSLIIDGKFDLFDLLKTSESL